MNRLEQVKNVAHKMLASYDKRQIGAFSASGGTHNTMAGVLSRRYGVPFVMTLEIITPILNDYIEDCTKFLGTLDTESDFVNWQDYLPK